MSLSQKDLVLGVGAGAAASFGPYLPALAVYVIPLIVPIAVTLMFQQMTVHLTLGVFGLLFLVVLFLLGSAGHRSFAQGVRLEFENAVLAHGLEHVQRRLEDAVDSMSEAFALFDADDRLVLANERLRELVPALNDQSNADITYEEFFRLFATTGLVGTTPDQTERWIDEFLRRRRLAGEPLEVELADGQWLRVGERATSDGGVVSMWGPRAPPSFPFANTRAMQMHLDEISCNVAAKAHGVVLMDRAGWHSTDKLKVPENLTIILLPSRSPELNPVENIWQYLRQNWLSNRVFEDYDAIIEAGCQAWNKLIDQPETIMSIGSREWAHKGR